MEALVIVEAVFSLVKGIIDWIAGLLPDGTIILPSPSDVGTFIGTRAGPFDKILPVTEAVEFAVIFITIWVPAAVTYQLAVWAYKHFPVLGKG